MHICKISIYSQFLSDSEVVDIKAITENHPSLRNKHPRVTKGNPAKTHPFHPVPGPGD